MEKIIDLIKISTKKNPADMMIKTIPVKKFRASLNFINILQKYSGEWALGRESCEVTKGREKAYLTVWRPISIKDSWIVSQGGDHWYF